VVTAAVIREHLSQFVVAGVIVKLSVPDKYVFVDEFRKTSVGKIDKKALRAQYGGE